MSRRLILRIGALLLIVMALVGMNTLRNAARWQPVTDTVDERLALILPGIRILAPDGPGPHPAAVLLSGCDGVRDNMDYWAGRMVALGRAAVIVDSHHPRGLDQLQAWRAVCAGQVMPGAERAGDLAVTLAWLRAQPGIDADDVALLGASHGGWTVMEFLDLASTGAVPPGLAEWPAPPDGLLAQLGPVFLLYPYCGVLNGAGKARWPARVAGLMILGDDDSIVDTAKCAQMGQELADRGARLQVVTLTGADHGFDQKERSTLSLLDYDAELTAEATGLFDDFMRGTDGLAAASGI